MSFHVTAPPCFCSVQCLAKVELGAIEAEKAEREEKKEEEGEEEEDHECSGVP